MKGREYIDNAPLREAFLASGHSASDVADRTGILDGRKGSARKGKPDVSRLRRLLGLARWHSKGELGVQVRISVENARRIAAALEVEVEDLYPELAAKGCGKCCERCGEDLLRPAPLCGWCIAEAEYEAGRAAA